MGLGDLERQVVRFEHPAHLIATASTGVLALGIGGCLLIGTVLVGISLPLDPLGEQPRIVDCHTDATPCLDDLPEWLRADPHPADEVEELAFQRIRGELEAEMARIRGEPAERWDALAQELEAGQPRGVGDWTDAEGVLQPVPADWPTFQSFHPRARWFTWAHRRARDLAEEEARAYQTAWRQGRNRRFDEVYDRTKRAHDRWRRLQRRWMLAVIGGVFGAVAVGLGLVALGLLALRRRWSPFEVVLTRHAIERDGENRAVLAGLSELDLQTLAASLQKTGHVPGCGVPELLEALRERRDAAERGALPTRTDQVALGALLEHRPEVPRSS